MQPAAHIVENQSRDTKGRREIRQILKDDPKKLLPWPPINLWMMVGWIVRPNASLSDAMAVECSYAEAMAEEAIWQREGGASRYDHLFPKRAAAIAKRKAKQIEKARSI